MKTTNFKIQRILSMLTIFLGAALLIFMIVAEDEPGAIPLFVIIGGTAWFFTIRKKIKSQQSYS